MHSSCDLSAEFENVSCDSCTNCPEMSHNSTYYEENQLYPEIIHPPIEYSKSGNIKEKWPTSIRIHEESVANIDLPPISWHGYGSIPKILSLTNTGRTILINGQWPRCRPYIAGGPLNGNYIFSQIHFHSPSEHEIDGKRYPLEMHVVHYKTSYLTQERAMEEKDGTVVLVYLFQIVNSEPTAFSSITNLVHHIERVNDRIELTNIALSEILQCFTSNYYIYWGSVSTKKNSYLLQWIISCSNLFVTQQEVNNLLRILCSDELFIQSKVSHMNIVNSVIFHVEEENYSMPVRKMNCSVCHLHEGFSKCQCRHQCRSCSTCAIHKGGSHPHSDNNELDFHASKYLKARNAKLQTSSCESSSRGTSKSSECDRKKKKKEKKKKAKSCEILDMSSSSVSLNSQLYDCEERKKKKKKKKKKKAPRTPKVSNSCSDQTTEKHIDFKEPKILSCSSLSKSSKTSVCVEVKNLAEVSQETGKELQKNETDGCDVSKNNSKSSVKNFKQKKKKKKMKKSENCKPSDSSSVSFKSKQKEKQKSKQKKDTESSDSSAGNSNSSLSDCKQAKKKKEDKKAEKCDLAIEFQCMPALENEAKMQKGLFELINKSLEENTEKEKTDAQISILPYGFEKLLQSKVEVNVEKTTACLERDDDIKTIFEKKRYCTKREPVLNNCAVNFLLSSDTLRNNYSETVKIINDCKNAKKANHGSSVGKSLNKVVTSWFELSSVKSKEQKKDFCLQTEHLIRTERKGDFSGCINQEYNVAIIYNDNILQEFRGTFHPSELELGSYAKLHLVPKYPDPENISVRLDDCFVKMENVDQLYIRAKFLLNKMKVNSNATEAENGIKEEIKISEIEYPKDKNLPCFEKNEFQCDNEKGAQIGCDQADFKNKILRNEECKIEVLKKPDYDPKQSNKSIAFDSSQQFSKSENEEERNENSLIEKADKTIKDLFYKRKKTVYFTYEKVEKDENSGKKIFVGSFRTKNEIKTLSKEKKILQKIDPIFSIEKSIEIDKEKKLFPLYSRESGFEELVKIENPTEEQESKTQSPAKCKKTDASNETKDSITFHKCEPKNSQQNYNKVERQSAQFRNRDIIIKSELFSFEEKDISERCDSFGEKPQKPSSEKKSQIALIIIPIEGENLSKIEVILVEHLKNVKKVDEEEEKEYVPCLDCYH